MRLTGDGLTPEARATLDALYEAWVIRVSETDDGSEPDAFEAGYHAGLAFVLAERLRDEIETSS